MAKKSEELSEYLSDDVEANPSSDSLTMSDDDEETADEEGQISPFSSQQWPQSFRLILHFTSVPITCPQ